MKDIKRFASVSTDLPREAAVGFILVEVMVSSFVLVLLTLLSMSYAARVYQQTCRMVQVCTQHAQMQVALDALVRDIAQAPVSKKLWRCATIKQHVWTTWQGDIGLENTTHGIIRSQGLFDGARKEWRHRTKSLLPPGISYSIELVSQDHACMYLVCVKITSTDKSSVATTIALRSGVCL